MERVRALLLHTTWLCFYQSERTSSFVIRQIYMKHLGIKHVNIQTVKQHHLTHLQVIGASLTKRQLESERSRLREAQRDRHDATFSEHYATVLLQKLHPDREEKRLDERIFFVLGAWTCRMQQLPARVFRTVWVDQHAWLRQEIEVIISGHTSTAAITHGTTSE